MRGGCVTRGAPLPQAIDEYSKAIDLSPDPAHKDVSVFYGNRAQCWASLDKYEEAEQDCMSALAIDPVYVKALCRRAMAREKMGKVDEALLDLTAACMLSGFQARSLVSIRLLLLGACYSLLWMLTLHPLTLHPLTLHPITLHPITLHPITLHPLTLHPITLHQNEMATSNTDRLIKEVRRLKPVVR